MDKNLIVLRLNVRHKNQIHSINFSRTKFKPAICSRTFFMPNVYLTVLTCRGTFITSDFSNFECSNFLSHSEFNLKLLNSSSGKFLKGFQDAVFWTQGFSEANTGQQFIYKAFSAFFLRIAG